MAPVDRWCCPYGQLRGEARRKKESLNGSSKIRSSLSTASWAAMNQTNRLPFRFPNFLGARATRLPSRPLSFPKVAKSRIAPRHIRPLSYSGRHLREGPFSFAECTKCPISAIRSPSRPTRWSFSQSKSAKGLQIGEDLESPVPLWAVTYFPRRSLVNSTVFTIYLVVVGEFWRN